MSVLQFMQHRIKLYTQGWLYSFQWTLAAKRIYLCQYLTQFYPESKRLISVKIQRSVSKVHIKFMQGDVERYITYFYNVHA